MGVLGKANIGGVLRNLTGEGYVNIGGVLRPITIGNFNIGGVLLAGGYTWKKYECVETVTYVEKEDTDVSTLGFGATSTVTLYRNKVFNSADGTFTLSGSTSVGGSKVGNNLGTYPYYPMSDGTVSKLKGSAGTAGSGSYLSYIYTRSLLYSEIGGTSYSQGTYIEDVTSPDASAYPENGRHTDGYWYVKQ